MSNIDEAIMPTSDSPTYRSFEEGRGMLTKTYMVVCDEGWRISIVCCGMYEWAAEWLVEQLQGKPYGRAKCKLT